MNKTFTRRKEDRTAERLLPSGTAVCPVCERRFEAEEEVEHVDFAGRLVWLCSERCRQEFDRQPLRYSE